jgi:hypothetical protein
MNAEQALLERALAGDPAATRELIVLVLPVVQVRIARVLARRRGGSRDIRQEVEDFAQEVFASLFERDSRVLRAWNAERGLSLASFCGMIAEREVASILRSGRRSPWTEDATAVEELEAEAGTVAPDAELRVASREHFERLTTRLHASLSPLGLQMFQRLIVDEESVESVCTSTGMSSDAVYAHRSRLARLARRLAAELAKSEPKLSAAAPSRNESEEKEVPSDVALGQRSRGVP